MTYALACEFHMLPKTCGWPTDLVGARGDSDALGWSKRSIDGMAFLGLCHIAVHQLLVLRKEVDSH